MHTMATARNLTRANRASHGPRVIAKVRARGVGKHPDENPCDDGWSFDGWNDDWSSVGWHECWEQTYDNSASSFPLGSFDIGAMSGPKRFEWVKMNLDTRAAVNTFPLNFGPY